MAKIVLDEAKPAVAFGMAKEGDNTPDQTMALITAAEDALSKLSAEQMREFLASKNLAPVHNMRTEQSLMQKIMEGEWHEVEFHSSGGRDYLGYIFCADRITGGKRVLSYDHKHWIPEIMLDQIRNCVRVETRCEDVLGPKGRMTMRDKFSHIRTHSAISYHNKQMGIPQCERDRMRQAAAGMN
jgi:hypothetical protein